MVDKAGATVLFEELKKGSSNNVGVVVSLVRIMSLGEFGSALNSSQTQGYSMYSAGCSWLLMDAEVIGFGETSGKGGMEVYEIRVQSGPQQGRDEEGVLGRVHLLEEAFIC